MSIQTEEIRGNGDWIKSNLKTKDGVVMLLILLLIGVIIYLYVENRDLKANELSHQNQIDEINKSHANELRQQRKDFKQEILDWKNIVDMMSNQSQEKADLSRKVVDLTKEKVEN